MIKNKFMKQQKGVIAIYAITTIFCFLLILGVIFISSTTVRRSQLKTILKVKEIYARQIQETSQIEADRNRVDISEYVQDNSLQVFYDAINNMGSSHSNNTKIWRDLSANKNDAIKQGSGELTWNTDAYVFTNPNSDYFESKNPISLGNSSRTIEIVYSLEETGVENLIGFGATSLTALNDIIYYGNGINLQYYDGDNSSAIQGISNDITVGKCYASTMIYDSTTQQMSYYTDSQSKSAVLFAALNTSSTTLTIGIGKDSTHNTNKRLKVKAIRIYNRVLTPSEREQNYQLDKTRYAITE